MGLADPWALGGATGKKPKKPKPPRIDLSSVVYSNPPSVSNGPSRGSYSAPAPQPVYQAPKPLRRDPGPYSVAETAWGASAFGNSKGLAPVISKLRSRLGDEPALNGLLSDLMSERYDTAMDRLDNRFSRQRTRYQLQLDQALDAQREGLDYEMPQMPKVPHIERGQGVKSLLETFSESIKPGMPKEIKDAYAKFYEYELQRLIGDNYNSGYTDKLRDQRNSLKSYRRNFLADAGLIDTREENDLLTDGGQDNSEFSPYSDYSDDDTDLSRGTSVPRVSPSSSSTPTPSSSTSSEPKEQEEPASGLAGLLGNPERLGSDIAKRDRKPWDPVPVGNRVLDALGMHPGSFGPRPNLPILDKILDESEDGMWWALDKLSRPLYGAMNAGQEYYAQDEEDDPSNFGDAIFGGGAGKSVFDPLDDLSWGGLKDIAGAAWDGFSGKEKTTFGHIVAENAANDGQKDLRDNGIWQIGVGLFGDVTMDPINAVGAGVIMRPALAAKSASDSVHNAIRMRTVSKQIADLLENSAPVVGPAEKPLSASEVYGIMSGKTGSKYLPRGAAAKKQGVADADARVARIQRRLNDAEFATDNDQLVSMREAAQAVAEQREAMLKKFEGETTLDLLRRDVEIEIGRGLRPASDLDDFTADLTNYHLVDRIPKLRARFWAQNNIAEGPMFNMGTSRKYEDIPVKGRWVHANSDVYLGEEVTDKSLTKGLNNDTEFDKVQREHHDTFVQDVSVKSEGKQVTAWPWQVLQREYARAVDLAERTKDPRHIRKAEEFRKKLSSETFPTARGEEISLGDDVATILPELKHDLRFSDDQLENLYPEVRRLALRNDDWKSIAGLSKNVKEEVNKYKAMLAKTDDSTSAWRVKQLQADYDRSMTRWKALERQKDNIEASLLTKILDDWAKGPDATTYKNPEAASQLLDELKFINEELSNGGHHLDDAGENVSTNGMASASELRRRRQEIHNELRTLEGPSSQAKYKRDLIHKAPDSVIRVVDSEEGFQVNGQRLRELVYLDRAGGYGAIKVAEKATDEEKAWGVTVADFVQQNYDTKFDAKYSPARSEFKRKRARATELGQKVPKEAYQKLDLAKQKASREAYDESIEMVEDGLRKNSLTASVYAGKFKIMPEPTKASTEDELIKFLSFRQGKEKTALQVQKHRAQANHMDAEVKRLDKQLQVLKEKHHAEKARLEAHAKEAKEAAKIMSRRVREEALLYAAQLATTTDKRLLSLKFFGQDLAIPNSDKLFDAVEKFSGLPLIKETRQAFANAFRSPASQLSPDARLARDRALGRTPNIIEAHINILKNTLGQIPEAERVRNFDSILKGNGYVLGEDHVHDTINAAFDDLLPYFNLKNKGPLAEGTLSVDDINKYLPAEFTINQRGSIDTVQDLVRAIQRGKQVNKANRNLLKDPYAVSWHLRVAVEQANARKGLEKTINSVFGVRDLKMTNPKDNDLGEIINEFQNLGWRKIPQLGNTHFYPPEALKDIHRLLDLMDPKNISSFGRVADRATGYWKTATTVYNPGYWTRNGIGEVMSSWFAGVDNPKWYGSAMGTIKYARGDGQELDALKTQFPMMNHIQSESVQGKQVAFRLKDGTPITHEQAWVAYNDMGLKTGFINTEFDQQYSKLGDLMRQNEGTQALANTHSKMRSAGEWYEDYLRMAHFHHAMANSGTKNLDAAARHAAAEVRKYHFDYTDFTPFEKTVMLRAFPFYKWTRKALPLMMTMLFTKPGKVMAYPKGMNALSNTLTTQDIAGDDNGFAPNYEGVIPGWMQDLWAYQIAGDEDEANETLLNINTPQMDIYKNVGNPGSTGYGLLNPWIKGPLESAQILTGNGDEQSFLKQMFGQADFPDNNTDMDVPLQNEDQGEGGAMLANLLRMMPQTNYAQKQGATGFDWGEAMPQETFGFLTGLGIYGNTPERRDAELMSRKNQR